MDWLENSLLTLCCQDTAANVSVLSSVLTCHTLWRLCLCCQRSIWQSASCCRWAVVNKEYWLVFTFTMSAKYMWLYLLGVIFWNELFYAEVCGWQKMTSVRFCKKNCGFRFGFSFTKLPAVSVFQFSFCTLCYLMCTHSTECFPACCFITVLFDCFNFTYMLLSTTLVGRKIAMMYFRAELVQLIVSWSDKTGSAEIWHEENYFDWWYCHAGKRIVNETTWKLS